MNKKIFSFLFLLVTTLSADLLQIEAGIGGWLKDSKGYLTYTEYGASGKYTSNNEQNKALYGWALFKHPLPIVPNIRAEYVNVLDNGELSGEFNDFTTTSSSGSFDMEQIDLIAYYNLLDNFAWLTLDLGLDLKLLNITLAAKGVSMKNFGGLEDYKSKDKIYIPLGFTRVCLALPMIDTTLETIAKYFEYNGSRMTDIYAKVDYMLIHEASGELGVELGYRIQKFYLNSEDEKIRIDLDYSGFYAGVMVKF